MSTDLIWQTVSTGSDDTMRIAAAVGSHLKGGEVIELVSDLGGGKTTFVQGLAKGAGSSDVVASPSFTISREYQADQLRIAHYDFYRLEEPGVIAAELQEGVHDAQTVTVIEWADIVEAILPAQRLTIKIEMTGPDERRIAFNYPDELSYLLGDLH